MQRGLDDDEIRESIEEERERQKLLANLLLRKSYIDIYSDDKIAIDKSYW